MSEFQGSDQYSSAEFDSQKPNRLVRGSINSASGYREGGSILEITINDENGPRRIIQTAHGTDFQDGDDILVDPATTCLYAKVGERQEPVDITYVPQPLEIEGSIGLSK